MKESTSDLYLAAFLQMKGLKPKAINHLGWLVEWNFEHERLPELKAEYEEIYKPYAREILKLKQAVREAKERRKRR